VGNSHKLDQWIERFPFMKGLPSDDLTRVTKVVQFPVLDAGQIAYEQEASCDNYLMCLEGRTRVFKLSNGGREMLIYKVEGGGTCMLTTQCLLSRSNFPAESIAEERTELAAIPASWFHVFMAEIPAFRDFVITDYTKLLGAMFSFMDQVAFSTIEQRLARRLLAEADGAQMVGKTHQQLAADVGSVREMVSRHLGEWERSGWVRTSRGKIEILDGAALASRQSR
jgi:CRP/FNR family transcriptional regulator